MSLAGPIADLTRAVQALDEELGTSATWHFTNSLCYLAHYGVKRRERKKAGLENKIVDERADRPPASARTRR
ncbi:MAG: hypothetical protein O7H40_05585 [Gammaproteobacteria bacterium]|nr:hypothetical protein [Gammaproteobacteria bacterium]